MCNEGWFGIEIITRHGQCSERTLIGVSPTGGADSSEARGRRWERMKSGERGQWKEERGCEGEDCGIASERLAFEPKERGIRPRSGADRGWGMGPEDGDACADDSSLANISLGVSSIEHDSRKDLTGIKEEKW